MASSPSLLIYFQHPTEEHFRKKQNLTQTNARSFPRTNNFQHFIHSSYKFLKEKATWVIIDKQRWKKKLCLEIDSLQYSLTWTMLRNLLVILWKLLRVTMARPGPRPRLQVRYSLSSAVDPSGHKSSYSCSSDSETRRHPSVWEPRLGTGTEMEYKTDGFSVEVAKGYADSTLGKVVFGKVLLLTKGGTSARAAPKYSSSCKCIYLKILTCKYYC